MSMTDSSYQGVFGPGDVNSAEADIYAVLNQMGLSSLAPRAWQAYKNGASIQRILADIYLTPEFKQRFPAYVARMEQGIPVTVGQIIEFETTGKELMRRYNMPGQFSTNEFLQNVMSQNIGLPEMQERLQFNRDRVLTMPQSVRDAYNEMFPGQGEGILTATLFLEFDESLEELERKVATAQVVGFGRDAGLDFTGADAQRLVDVTTDPDRIRQTLGQLGEDRALFRETISEAGDDLRAEREGLDRAISQGTGAAEIEKRRAQRVANSRTNVGGGITERGSYTLGSSD